MASTKRTKSRSRKSKRSTKSNTYNTTPILIIILVSCILLLHNTSNSNIFSDIRYNIISNIPSIIKTIYQENELLFNTLKFLSDLANILFWIVGSGLLYYYKYYKNPREHIISVQMNVVTGVTDKDHTTSVTQCDTEEDAWEGKLVWSVISEGIAPDKAFQRLLRIARKKPRALPKDCPTLELLDTGPYNVKSILWQNIYGLASTHLVNTHALTRGAVGVKVKRYRFIGCLTYVTAVGKHPKMRMLLVSRKQLKYLHDHPNYGKDNDSNKRVGFFSQKWNCLQRLVQLQELGRHVEATGGFNDLTFTDQNHHKDGVDRYYFGIEVWI